MNRFLHHVRGHRVMVRWGHPGWQYRCSCGREWLS